MKKTLCALTVLALTAFASPARDVAGAGELFDPFYITLAPLSFFELHTSGDFMDPGSLHTNLFDSVVYPWIAQKVDTATFTTAMALKADASSVTASLNSASNVLATAAAANFNTTTNYLGGMTNALSANTVAITTKQALLPTGASTLYLGGDMALHTLPVGAAPIQVLSTNGLFVNGGVYNNAGVGTYNLKVFGTLVLGLVAGGCSAEMWIRTNAGPWKLSDQASDQALVGAARSPKFTMNANVPKGWDVTFTNVSVTGVGSSISWNPTNLVTYYNDPNP